MKKLNIYLIIIFLVFISCERDNDIELTTISVVNEQFTPSYTSAGVRCRFTTDATLRNVYLQSSLTSDFTEYEEVAMWESDGNYHANLVDLQDNTTYYIRYSVSNRFSSVIVNDISQFSTLQPSVPTISIDSIGDIWDTHAKAFINLSFDGGTPISKMGICWGTQPNVTIQDNKKEAQTTTSVFDITSLQPNTTYYIRAYAENKKGVSYTEEKSFITFALPEVQTSDITDIQLTSALLAGSLIFDGNDAATVAGFCWGRSSEPTLLGNHQELKVTNNSFSYALSNLEDETQYFVRAYARNKIGVVYGEEKSFTTQSAVIPTVITTDATNISYTTATVGGTITSDGGADITERGVCYSTTVNPTIENTKITSGTGTGTYTINLTELTDSTTYYVRAYAINKKGISYGKNVSLMTKPKELATISTVSVTEVTSYSAVVSVLITSDGGTSIIESGFCYSTSNIPNISNTKIVNTSLKSDFSCQIIGLQKNTTYYIRAYAINAIGVAYSDAITIQTINPIENGHEYVDLGLSVKWATMNIGAVSPEDYGDYFTWGEIEPKDEYRSGNYKWYNWRSGKFTKYGTDSEVGVVDHKLTLDMEDDAAHMNWGGNWRMPTMIECTELDTNCRWTLTSRNGVIGYEIIGPNGNSIFLPAAGSNYSGLDHQGVQGRYWARNLNEYLSDYAIVLYFDSSYYYEVTSSYRALGLSIRPVCP